MGQIERTPLANETQELSSSIAEPTGADQSSSVPATGGSAESALERTRRRAYEMWEAEGRPDGHHERHWGEAERENGAPAEAEYGRTFAAAEPDDEVSHHLEPDSGSPFPMSSSMAAE